MIEIDEVVGNVVKGVVDGVAWIVIGIGVVDVGDRIVLVGRKVSSRQF